MEEYSDSPKNPLGNLKLPTPLPPTPASPMESHWMTVVIQLDVDCWSFNALPRTDYEVV